MIAITTIKLNVAAMTNLCDYSKCLHEHFITIKQKTCDITLGSNFQRITEYTLYARVYPKLRGP